jgi:Rps23 Pro-64 3,4-dihydroxylase Tpa1-like proline 4-hydroxylase
MSTQHAVNLVEVRKEPFSYCVATGIYDEATCKALMDYLEGDAPWRLVRQRFYSQYEFALDQDSLSGVCDLLGRAHLRRITGLIEEAFQVQLEDRVEAVAHKMIKGQKIGIHNDFGAPWRTHRLVVQLNRGFEEDHGGQLLFFNSHDPNDVHRSFRPVHNTAVAFALTSAAYHAVSEITDGIRYSIVYSFWAASKKAKAG